MFMPRQDHPNIKLVQNGIGPHYYLGKHRLSHLGIPSKYQSSD